VSTAEAVGHRNVAVINGSDASFHCVINASQFQLCWTHQSLSSELEYTNLYRNGVLRPICGDNKCNVTCNNDTNSYELTISSVQHYDAGFYACRICRKRKQQAVQLIVLHPGESLMYSADDSITIKL